MISAKTYDKRSKAIAAAVFTLGPEARSGFEFEAYQRADGKWAWKPTDERKPMTQMEAKMQGRRFRAGMPDQGLARYHPPGALANTYSTRSNCVAGARAQLGEKAKPGVEFEVTECLNPVDPERPRFRFRALNGHAAPGLRTAPPAKAKAAAAVKNPPAAEPKEAKPAKGGIGATARAAILAGATNEQALARVLAEHPGAGTNLGNISWYRGKLKRDGKLSADSMSARGSAKDFGVAGS